MERRRKRRIGRKKVKIMLYSLLYLLLAAALLYGVLYVLNGQRPGAVKDRLIRGD